MPNSSKVNENQGSERSVLDGLDELFDAAKNMEFEPYNGINSMRKQALALGALGFKVFPVFHMQPGPNGEPECSCCAGQRYFAKLEGNENLAEIKCWNKPGKHPRGKWKELATSDADAIKELWSNKRGSNIAIATGQPSGIFVVDLDGETGFTSLRELEAMHGALPPTVMAFSGRGDGLHLYFKAPAEEEGLTISAGTIGAGIDTRGTGGYIIAPGSNHESLRRYMWVPGYAPGEVEFAELPEWFIDAMKAASNATIEQRATKKAAKKESSAKGKAHADPDYYDARFDIFDDAAKEMASGGWEVGEDGELLLGVEAYLARIGEPETGKPYRGFHGPTYSALCAFFYHHGLEATDEEAKAIVVPVIKAAPCKDGRNLNRYATDRYLDHRIADAREFIATAKREEQARIENAYEKLKGLIEGFSDWTDKATMDRAFQKLALLKIPPKLRQGLVKTLAVKAGMKETKVESALQKIADKHKEKVWRERKELERQAQNAAAVHGDGADIQPELMIGRDGFDYQVATSWGRLSALNKVSPKYFEMGGVKKVRLSEPDEEGRILSEVFDAKSMVSELNVHVRWVKPRGDADSIVVSADPHVAEQILNQSDLHFPRLEAVAHSPFFTREGELVSVPGYHAGSRTYYSPPSGFVLPDIPERPTLADVKAARALIEDNLLVDFPFSDGGEEGDTGKSSKAHAIALLLEPLMRPMIPDLTPAYFVNKPMAGTGASLLIQSVARVATGSEVGAQTETKNDEEQRKSITAFLLSGAPVFFLDNINAHLHGSAYANLLTCGVWEDRKLGVSNKVRLPVRCSFVFAGNNVNMSKEIARRCLPIMLDAQRDPTERSLFKHNLKQWVPANRAALVAACLTLIKYWIVEGQPKWSGKPLASFEAYCQTMGGLLEAIGVEGFCGNLALTASASSSEDEAYAELFSMWLDEFGEEPRQIGNPFVGNGGQERGDFDGENSILHLIEANGFAIPIGEGDARQKVQKLGMLLHHRNGRVFTYEGRSMRLIGGGRRGKNKQLWAVELVRLNPFTQAAEEMALQYPADDWCETEGRYQQAHDDMLREWERLRAFRAASCDQ